MKTHSFTGGSSTIPPEVLRSSPREVKLTAGGMLAWILAVVLSLGAIVGGALIFAASSHWSSLKAEMRTSGQTVDGSVVRVQRISGKNPARLVSYRYLVADRSYGNAMRLRLHQSANLFVGSPVQVRYLPRDPQIGWLQGFEPSGVPVFLFPLTLILAGPLVSLLVWNLRKQHSLLTEGRPVLALVTSVETARKGDKRVLRVKYEFQIFSGAMRSGVFDVQRNPPAVGTTIVILYDRDDPSRQLRYPVSLYRLEGAMRLPAARTNLRNSRLRLTA